MRRLSERRREQKATPPLNAPDTATDPRFAKYPRLPVIVCLEYEPVPRTSEELESADEPSDAI